MLTCERLSSTLVVIRGGASGHLVGGVGDSLLGLVQGRLA